MSNAALTMLPNFFAKTRKFLFKVRKQLNLFSSDGKKSLQKNSSGHLESSFVSLSENFRQLLRKTSLKIQKETLFWIIVSKTDVRSQELPLDKKKVVFKKAGRELFYKILRNCSSKSKKTGSKSKFLSKNTYFKNLLWKSEMQLWRTCRNSCRLSRKLSFKIREGTYINT